MTDQLPLTRIPAEPARAEAIRAAVRSALLPLGSGFELGRLDHAEAFFKLVGDPAVNDPIATLPRPITLETCRGFIKDRIAAKARGEGLLILMVGDGGRIVGYQDIAVWPEWSAAALGGAIHPDAQGSGRGRAGARRAFDWIFETLGVDLICETASLDNIRSRKIMEGAGFSYRGEIDLALPGGGARRSRYWELTRPEWIAFRDAHPVGPKASAGAIRG
ncbi:MAG: GNAT family N-acetyltransferase [Parvularculaceae bacterium]|nr:GNAT family N-acetyltransferase [Parvularculaceae bacterium]